MKVLYVLCNYSTKPARRLAETSSSYYSRYLSWLWTLSTQIPRLRLGDLTGNLALGTCKMQKWWFGL